MRPLCVSVNQVKDELGASGANSSMGIYLDRLADSEGQARIITRQIDEAQSWIELRLGVYMFQTRVVTRPVTMGKIRGRDYDVEEDGYPYSRNDFSRYGTVYLRRRPVVHVERAGLRMGNATEQLAANEWPPGWINPQQRMGILHILPILGTGGQMGAGSALLLPLIAGHFPGNVDIPLIFSVDYTAGFLPTDFDPDDPDMHASTASPDFDCNPLVNATRMRAAAGVLAILGRTIAPGGGGIGMDGFSQSWQGNRFQAEIDDYNRRCEEEISMMESQFPVPVVGI